MQPRDKTAMLGVNTIEFTWKKSLVPRGERCFYQHGRRDVTCKPAIDEDFRKKNLFQILGLTGSCILGSQPRDKAAILAVNTIEFTWK